MGPLDSTVLLLAEIHEVEDKVLTIVAVAYDELDCSLVSLLVGSCISGCDHRVRVYENSL